jgi:hypothetical protein
MIAQKAIYARNYLLFSADRPTHPRRGWTGIPIPYQRLVSSVRGPNNYLLFEPTIRRGVEYFLDNSAKEHSSAKSNRYRPLPSKINIRPFRRRRKIFGRTNHHLFFDEIKRWYGILFAWPYGLFTRGQFHDSLQTGAFQAPVPRQFGAT